ncbi:DgyrCDS12248 [Dimorphilus gyrociliatus]|uniref:DgyrCDS12248 n=1 Tax=Dimorphilus gyrociliatus TaxID=2664684 RepID=A0A7I8W8I5_9ANNE|nr:DgyrCDS12248 [Dimorphilus gyrociliatus]
MKEEREYWDFERRRRSSTKRKVAELEVPDGWSTVWYNFTQTTTLHGINKVTESTPFIWRRIIWLIIVLAGLTVFGYQMFNSIQYYFNRPVTVNIAINYNESIRFPSVTLCNQNVFRMTAAAKHKLYPLIDALYTANTKAINFTDYQLNLTLVDLYKKTAHRKEDMITECRWDSEPCSLADFVEVYTDHGVCFTFNKAKSAAVRYINSTGARRGLSVKVNLEQYEYMKGPNNAAGLKILVHDQDEVPLVRELGQAIPPSSRALVGLKITQVNNLKYPYGKCNDSEYLRFYKSYSIPACKVECKLKHVVEDCKCREAYMPHVRSRENFPRVCTLNETRHCVMAALKKKYACNCATSCQKRMFEASISYSTTSEFDTDRILHSEQIHDLQKKFIMAREVAQKVKSYIRIKDEEAVYRVNETAKRLQTAFGRIDGVLMHLYEFVERKRSEHLCRNEFHRNVALYTADRLTTTEFIVSWNSFAEGLLVPVATSMKRLLNDVEYVVEESSRDDSKEMMSETRRSISVQLKLILECLKEFDSVIQTFSRGRVTLDENDRKINLSYTLLQKLIPRSIIKRKWSKEKDNFIALNDTLNQTYTDLLTIKKEFAKANIETSVIDDTVKKLRIGASKLITLRHYLEEQVIHSLRDDIRRKTNYFEKKYALFVKEKGDLLMLLGNVKDLMMDLNNSIWPVFTNLINVSIAYLKLPHARKTNLAGHLLGEQVSHKLQEFQVLFNDIRARTRNFNHDWQKFTNTYVGVLESIGTEEMTRQFYKTLKKYKKDITKLNITDWCPYCSNCYNVTETLSFDLPWLEGRRHIEMYIENEVKAQMEKLRSESEMSKIVGDLDEQFYQVFLQWRRNIEEFQKGNEIDVNFISNNFMEVDIFMRELFYEKVEQQIGYEITNLWSDIGGSMGLFIGGSVLTLFEVIDTIFHHIFKSSMLKRKERKLKKQQMKMLDRS